MNAAVRPSARCLSTVGSMREATAPPTTVPRPRPSAAERPLAVRLAARAARERIGRRPGGIGSRDCHIEPDCGDVVSRTLRCAARYRCRADGPVASMTSRPAPLGMLGDWRVRLVLTSATLLFVELLLIRWIPSTVRYIGFFSNFLLMASFLGIGLGILIGRKVDLRAMAIFPILLAAVVWLATSLELNIQVRSTNELFFGLAENQAADLNFLVLPLVFTLVTALMAALALPLGPLLKAGPPLRVYAFDIT